MLAQGTITTYAGSDSIFADSGQPATSAHLLGPDSVAVDSQGNVYIPNSGLQMVLKVVNGTISIAAGNGLNATEATADWPLAHHLHIRRLRLSIHPATFTSPTRTPV